jgi:hypothetical protein
MRSGPTPLLVLRTSTAMYVLSGSILGGSFVLVAFVAIVKEPTLWLPATVMGAVLAIVLTWLATTTLSLTTDAIHYRSLLVRTDVPLADVLRAKFVTGFSGYKPYQRLVLTVREKSGQRDIVINTGLFDRAQIKRWMDLLNARRSSYR